MRIIAGKYRSRILNTLDGQTTRPTADKIKESLFNMIGPYFDGGTMLDCCAGCGAIGLECLSRGFDHAVFVDQNKRALQVIRSNIELLKVNGQTTLINDDVVNYLEQCDRSFDLIYVDPPYDQHKLYDAIMEKVSIHHRLTENGSLIVETDITHLLPETMEHLVLTKKKDYRRTSLYFYRFKGE